MATFAQELTATSAATMQATRAVIVDEVVTGFRVACVLRAKEAASSAASTKMYMFDDADGPAKRNGFIDLEFRARLHDGINQQLDALGLSEYKVHLSGQRRCTDHYEDCPIEDPRICRAKIKVTGTWPCVWDTGRSCLDGAQSSRRPSRELADFLLICPIDAVDGAGDDSKCHSLLSSVRAGISEVDVDDF